MSNELNKITSARIKKLRTEILKMTQEQFYEKTDLSVPTIKNIEGGKSLSINSAIMISKSCNVSLDWLYGVTEETNDEIGMILSAMKKYVGFEKKNDWYTVSINDTILEYFNRIAEIDRTKIENNLPDEPYKLWIDKTNSDYKEKLKNTDLNQRTDYVLEAHSTSGTAEQCKAALKEYLQQMKYSDDSIYFILLTDYYKNIEWKDGTPQNLPDVLKQIQADRYCAGFTPIIEIRGTNPANPPSNVGF